MYKTTLHAYFTPEYTLTAMLAGTYSLAVVPALQGALEASPKALRSILVTDVGSVMLERPVHW